MNLDMLALLSKSPLIPADAGIQPLPNPRTLIVAKAGSPRPRGRTDGNNNNDGSASSAGRIFRGRNRLDVLSFAHEVLSLPDHARPVRNAADPHGGLLVLDHIDGDETDNSFGVDGAHPEIAARREGQRRARHIGGRD